MIKVTVVKISWPDMTHTKNGRQRRLFLACVISGQQKIYQLKKTRYPLIIENIQVRQDPVPLFKLARPYSNVCPQFFFFPLASFPIIIRYNLKFRHRHLLQSPLINSGSPTYN